MTVMLRDAEARDEAAWRTLWAAYLAFYRTDLAPEVTAAVWARILDPSNRLSCRVAEVGGALAGFATWHHHVATWHLADDCYLEDLYVDDAARGMGLGRALIDDLVAVARARGFGRVYWHTNEANTRARALYDSYVSADGHLRYRILL